MNSPKIGPLQGPRRRVVFVGLYECFAVLFAGLLFMLSGQDAVHSGGMSVAASAIAVAWNVTFNHWFERWEARQRVRGRSWMRRVMHALGFEGGLALMLIPLMAWWFGIALLEAAALQAGLLTFFLVYTYAFNWCFDWCFGLPRSAAG